MAENQDDDARGRHSGSISGLRWEAEECPDASSGDALRATAGGGAIGFVSAMLMGLSPGMRIVAALAGAAIGHVAASYHLNLDWDPDALRGGDDPPRGDDERAPDVRPF